MSYEKRKKDHIRLALEKKNQAYTNAFSKIHLLHEALPELDWSEINTSTFILGEKRKTPFFVCGMTGGFKEALDINLRIAKSCQKRGWIMGLGSQRKLLTHPETQNEWLEIRNQYPDLCILGNLGITQLIKTPLDKIEELVKMTGVSAMVIHTNPLQECLQPEGTPQFKGGFEALIKCAKKLTIPVCLKETGCGFSFATLKKLCGAGIQAIDLSGYGGTHWGRIEGDRNVATNTNSKTSETYRYWGNTTFSSLMDAQQCKERDYEIWASGGIKNGLNSAKCLALGAQAVGFAHLILKQALLGEQELDYQMNLLEHELKVAMFCTGSKSLQDLKTHWKINP